MILNTLRRRIKVTFLTTYHMKFAREETQGSADTEPTVTHSRRIAYEMILN